MIIPAPESGSGTLLAKGAPRTAFTATAAVNNNNPITVRQLSEDDISAVLELQNDVLSPLAGTPNRVHLKQRSQNDFKSIINGPSPDKKGVLFGAFHDNKLIATGGVNRALNHGRVEINIPETLNPENGAVLQAAMCHPDICGTGIANILYMERMQWAFDHSITDMYVSLVTKKTNGITGETHGGNKTVLNGLGKKGFVELPPKDASFVINENGYDINIGTFHKKMPKTHGELIHHFRETMPGDMVEKWVKQPSTDAAPAHAIL